MKPLVCDDFENLNSVENRNTTLFLDLILILNVTL